jgi:hypothetical protein
LIDHQFEKRIKFGHTSQVQGVERESKMFV